MLEKIKNTILSIRKVIGDFTPEIGVVLGSGLGNFGDKVDVEFVINYSDIESFPQSTVEGHSGKLIFGTVEGRKVVVMSGRFHYYEGYEPKDVVYGVRVMKLLGINKLFLSNAAGALNENYSIGDIMIITDHISFIPNPLIGKNIPQFGERFPSMTQAYSNRINSIANELGYRNGINIQNGVYIATTGPSYETKAEIKFYKIIGGDAVGMSTAPEVIAAVHMGIEVFAVSVITNITVSSVGQPPTHEEVMETGKMASKNLSNLFVQLISMV